MNRLKAVIGVSVAFLIYTIILFYIGWNGYVWLSSLEILDYPIPYIALIILFGYSYILSHVSHFSFFKIIGSYWLAILQYGILIFPIANIACYVLNPYIQATEIIGSITFLLIAFILIYGSFNAYSPIIRTYKLTIAKKHARRPSLKIAMASDMHFGTLSGRKHLNRLVTNINDLQPDLILFPGDIIDDDPTPFMKKKMGDQLAKLYAPLGIYGVLGNHEYYGKMIPEFIKEMERVGVKILLDEKITIDDTIRLIGRKDKTDKDRLTIPSLLENEESTLPIVMMDHQPAELEAAMNDGIDVILSGHTHRGQMAPNHLITKKVFELDWGYKKKKQLHAIVSSGFGFWGPPIRIGSRSEILYIDITFE
ncbi:metallophosphoesterase [Bacillus sp. B1-b2]|uniref:metallophosphoesterase n=1 Tax=Bacillus sp. B1-b2 TaxID=2653201 RepID=UPI0012619BBA|nr:metallophosphoesterase [Bacillus sp. B1-b2]KAB7669946.1 metallophosphoesterase [Bacillus sp. B1-b2]